MPYKRGKLKGELTGPEIRKLIKAHNKLNTIKIPPKSKRDDLIKLVENSGYKVNHKGQNIVRDVNKKEVITLSGAEKMFPKQVRKPKKVVIQTAKKEDEVRPARQPAPPVPKAKDFVKIGAKPKQGRIDTSAKNPGKVITAQEKKKITLEQAERFKGIKERMEKLKKEKALTTFRNQWNIQLSKNYSWASSKKDRIDDIVNGRGDITLQKVNLTSDGFELVYDTPTSKGVKTMYTLPKPNWETIKAKPTVGPLAKKIREEPKGKVKKEVKKIEDKKN